MATRNKDFMMKQATHHGNKEQGLHDEAGYSPWQQGTRTSWWSRLLTMATRNKDFVMKQATHHGNKEQGFHDEAGYSPWQQGTRTSWWCRLLTMATTTRISWCFRWSQTVNRQCCGCLLTLTFAHDEICVIPDFTLYSELSSNKDQRILSPGPGVKCNLQVII